GDLQTSCSKNLDHGMIHIAHTLIPSALFRTRWDYLLSRSLRRRKNRRSPIPILVTYKHGAVRT
ncbi:MAG: hypothetical protein KBA38_01750, partial [Negativicutes bacterium]|nr:hypothetical protein [Negativicutes bacterium]